MKLPDTIEQENSEAAILSCIVLFVIYIKVQFSHCVFKYFS